MAVLLNCFILCVWQFHLVRSKVNLPFTSISYKMSPITPKSLSLSFSTNDSVESKIINDLEDLNFNLINNSSSSQDEKLSKNTVSVSGLLSKLGLISDSDPALKDLNYSKQKQNIDLNINKVAPLPQNKIPNLRSNIKEKSEVPEDVQNKKNTVNYNIKVISPPAVFSKFPISSPVTQNVGYSKWLVERNRYSKNLPTTPLRSYPVRLPTEGDKQESTTAWQKVGRTFSKNDETGYNLVEPLIRNNPIDIANHDIHKIRNIVKNEDTTVTSKDKTKFTYSLDITKPPFNIDTPSDILDNNSHQIPMKILDTSFIKNHDILLNDANNQELVTEVCTLNKLNTESNKINDNMNSFNNIKDDQIPKYISMQNILSTKPLSYGSKPSYISDKSPTLPKSSPPRLPEISEVRHICTSGYDNYNLPLGSSLDNIISFLLSKFIFAYSDKSATKSMQIPTPLDSPELPDITTDVTDKLSKTPLPVYDSSYPEVESPTYLPKPNVDIILKDADDANTKTITKSPVPYISSITINYMPRIESSDDIIIFV